MLLAAATRKVLEEYKRYACLVHLYIKPSSKLRFSVLLTIAVSELRQFMKQFSLKAMFAWNLWIFENSGKFKAKARKASFYSADEDFLYTML